MVEWLTGRRVSKDVSAIVVTHNSARWTKACLDAVLASSPKVGQAIVVDNASSDGTTTIANGYSPDVEVVSLRSNTGFAGGANEGARMSHADVLVFLNPDVTVHERTIDALTSAIKGSAEVGVAGGKLLYPDGKTIQHAGGQLSYPLALADHYGYGEPDRGQCEEPRDADYVTGALMAVRRSVLEEVGYFDEGFYPAYFEETDLCFRVRAAGYRVLYAPDAVATHHESVTTGKNTLTYYHLYHRNRLRFVLKHYTDTQFWQDFLPAELERLRCLESTTEVTGLTRAYADNLNVLQGRATFLANPAAAAPLPVTRARMEGLGLLRATAEARLAGRDGELKMWSERLSHLRSMAQLRERDFTSSAPVIGPLIVRARRAWNWMSTEWYVRPLIQQQSEVNRGLIQVLDQIDLSVQALHVGMSENEEAILRSNREQTALEARIARLERQVAELREQLKAGQSMQMDGDQGP